METIKKNFAFNLLLTMSSYIVSFIVFPYISRVLGVENIGRIGFADNIIAYFTLFSTMGIGILGVREIASCGNDKHLRTEIFSSIFTLLALQTLIIVVIYVTAIFVIPKFFEYKNLLFLGFFAIMFGAMSVEWLFQGIENFKFVTLRTLAVRLVFAACVFIFIKGPEDTILYFSLSVISIVCTSLINIIYARQYVQINLKFTGIKTYLKSFYSLGIYKLMVSMYTTFNVVFLGFVCDDLQVGYYYTAIKIYYVCIGVLNAYSAVVLPRMSSLLSKSETHEFNRRIKTSTSIVSSSSILLSTLCICLAPQIIRLLSGNGYEGAILPMRLIMPALIVSGLGQIWVIQVLIPLKKDNVILNGAIIGAVIGVISNIVFVKNLGSTGSALSLLISELFSNLYCFFYLVKNKMISFSFFITPKVMISLLISSVICILCVLCNMYLH